MVSLCHYCKPTKTQLSKTYKSNKGSTDRCSQDSQDDSWWTAEIHSSGGGICQWVNFFQAFLAESQKEVCRTPHNWHKKYVKDHALQRWGQYCVIWSNVKYYVCCKSSTEHTIPIVKHVGGNIMVRGCFSLSSWRRWLELMGTWKEPDRGQTWQKICWSL